MMKIVVVGAGAMGCLFAAYLSKSKEEIWILEKDKERAQKLNQQGIGIEGVSGDWKAKARASADAAEIGPADLVLVCVKSYDTKEAVSRIKGLVAENSKVITLQNGIGNVEIIQEAVGQEKVIAGVTSQGATLLDAGRIRHAGRGETIIGRIDGKIPVELRAIREIFNKVGLPARISRDIKGLLWGKLIINV
ncbi:MAG: ketopantoate reductase family protein, partial [Candidatus Omnitrophota bacterium]|nr:ketopantoate reductase family protein [Candidatus Omnitrophota bacterium]